jgi:hypothetical protein
MVTDACVSGLVALAAGTMLLLARETPATTGLRRAAA